MGDGNESYLSNLYIINDAFPEQQQRTSCTSSIFQTPMVTSRAAADDIFIIDSS